MIVVTAAICSSADGPPEALIDLCHALSALQVEPAACPEVIGR